MLLCIRSQGYLKVLYLGLVFSIEIYGRLQVVYFRHYSLKTLTGFFLDALYLSSHRIGAKPAIELETAVHSLILAV